MAKLGLGNVLGAVEKIATKVESDVARALEPAPKAATPDAPTGTWADGYKDAHAHQVYEQSLNGRPVQSYDPQGFLASLGLKDVRAAGRTDANLLRAFSVTDYQPNQHYLPGPKWLTSRAQGLFLALGKHFPDAAAALDGLITKLVVKDDRGNAQLPEYGEAITSAALPQKPGERYVGAVRDLDDAEDQFAFGSDFHEGSINRKGGGGFGTFDIAKRLGFSEDQATRVARMDFNVDTNETPYKGLDGQPRHTASANGGDLHWHFNRAAQGEEDTRLVAAQVHLQRAVTAAKAGQYDAAEQELGVGLHSLQDLFAHGQLSPIGHTVLDEFPDTIPFTPRSAYEGELATEAYLGSYLHQIGVVADAPVTASIPASARASGQELQTILGAVPADVRALATQKATQIAITDPKVRPTDLGFGDDLDHDGKIEAASSRDVDGDGKVSAVEREGDRGDGRSWNDLPGGFDAQRGVLFVDRSAFANGTVGQIARHELVHAAVSALEAEPKAASAMQASWEAARDRGDLGRQEVNLQEYLADRLSGLSDADLSAAIGKLRAGQAI